MTHPSIIARKRARPRLLVIGDLILDCYTWGDADRVSPEAPVLVLRSDQREVRPGGAASVAFLARGLEAEVSLAGVVGDDQEGRVLRKLLSEADISDDPVLVDPERWTTVKERFIGRAAGRHPHQILRVDRDATAPLRRSLVSTLLDHVLPRIPACDAVLIADYAKGCCSARVVRTVIKHAANAGVPVLVDPARGVGFRRYRGATVVKPNRIEAEAEIGRRIRTIADAQIAARELKSTNRLGAVLITLDSDGQVLAAGTSQEPTHIPSRARIVYDITGAGDMALAALGCGFGSGMSITDSAIFANAAAGLEVEHTGVFQITREQLEDELTVHHCGSKTSNHPCRDTTPAKFVTIEQAEELVGDYRRVGKRVVFSNGCFDLLHTGHVRCLEQASKEGDCLFVAVNSDASVTRLKGRGRPVIPQEQRITMLAALSSVDHIVLLDDDTPELLLRRLKPDVLVKGATTSDVAGRDIIEAYGGSVRLLRDAEPVSTTRIVTRLRESATCSPSN